MLNLVQVKFSPVILHEHLHQGGASLECFQADLGPNVFLQVFVAREPWNDDGRQLLHASASVRHKNSMAVLRLPTDEELSAVRKLASPDGATEFDRTFTEDHAHLWEKIR